VTLESGSSDGSFEFMLGCITTSRLVVPGSLVVLFAEGTVPGTVLLN